MDRYDERSPVSEILNVWIYPEPKFRTAVNLYRNHSDPSAHGKHGSFAGTLPVLDHTAHNVVRNSAEITEFSTSTVARPRAPFYGTFVGFVPF